uniref:Ion_trans domain-containing protein n=1 Tax=Ascaris lumbricoides TaxID=6252 RepID=A0A0M3I4R5_ASCLU
ERLERSTSVGGTSEAGCAQTADSLFAEDESTKFEQSTAEVISDNIPSNQFLRVNVGGTHFLLRANTVIERRCGLIHQPTYVCPQDLLDELDYWGIVPDAYLASCCCADQLTVDHQSENEEEYEKPNYFKHLRCGEYRRKVWNLIEKPSSSTAAQIFAAFSVLFLLISICGLVLGSLPELQVPVLKQNSSDNSLIIEMEPHPFLEHIEQICIVWFTLEYVSKMLVSYDRRTTALKLLNMIDLMAILPFLIEIALMLIGINTEELRDIKGAFLVIRILRVLRVIRVLKLGRYSSGLQMFGKTLKASFRQLGMMAMVVLTGVIFFSTLVYFLEKDEPGSEFYSIPAACWW